MPHNHVISLPRAVKPPRISVVMTAFNVEQYIERSVSAILAQTYPDFELIIVDDGSRDNTVHILSRLANQEPRIRLIENGKNCGIIDSANKGISVARGEFVARTDSDDQVEAVWLETLLAEMEKDSELLAVSSYLTFCHERKSGYLGKSNHHGSVHKVPLLDAEIKKEMMFSAPMCHGSALIRSSVFTQHGIRYHHAYQAAEDYKLWLDIAKIGKMANVPQSLLNYRLHERQTSSVAAKTQGVNGKKIRREAIEWYFSKLGIDFKLPKQPSYSDLYRLFQNADHAPAEQADLLNRILYECCMSLSHHSWRELVILFCSGYLDRFSSKQRLKIVKKHLRPQKYRAMI